MSGEAIQIFHCTLEEPSRDIPKVRDESRPLLLEYFSSIETNRILLAVEEALVNVFEHGYGGTPGKVEFSIRKKNESLFISLEDDAPPFDPTEAPLTDPGERSASGEAGGYGLYLLRTLMKVRHEAGERGGNRLILEREIRGRE